MQEVQVDVDEHFSQPNINSEHFLQFPSIFISFSKQTVFSPFPQVPSSLKPCSHIHFPSYRTAESSRHFEHFNGSSHVKHPLIKIEHFKHKYKSLSSIQVLSSLNPFLQLHFPSTNLAVSSKHFVHVA